MLPFSEACERNKAPILVQLRHYLAAVQRVLELGSGTGQHAVFFAEHLPHLIWQCSDLPQRCDLMAERLRLSRQPNLPAPLPLEIGLQCPDPVYDAVFSANVTHILAADRLPAFFHCAAAGLRETGLLICYGPFQKAGEHNSEGNRQFDASLKAQGHGGIPDLLDLASMASQAGLDFIEEVAMPANNRLLVYSKTHNDPAR